ncbi:TPA: hypothetical protein GRR63_23180 [Vibrio parahaemolyticus]|nr:hypothetical protein [Vibrio parahaemolyticus]
MSELIFHCPTWLMSVNSHNKQFKQIRNAWHFWFESVLVFTAQWFRCGGRVAHYLIGR